MERNAAPPLKRLGAGRYSLGDKYEICFEGWIGKQRCWRVWWLESKTDNRFSREWHPNMGFPTLKEAVADVLQEIEAENEQKHN